MIDRRKFVQQGAMVAALISTTLEVTYAGGASRNGAANRTHLALFDRRFAAARRFARTIGAQDVATHAITGDVTSIWFHELHPLWRRPHQPVAIAGFTTYAPLFCLERLAWDHGMRVIQRDQHDARMTGEPDQLLYSWVIAPRRSA